jgi:hypothetical protein
LTPNDYSPFFPVKTNRDVLIFRIASDEALVVGCDSAGGIGPKPLDKIKVDALTLGKFTARAALMEVLAAGANPICIVDTLGVEPEPAGREILSGIQAEAAQAGLESERAVTGSTEKNIPVEQTGIGVTVIATCKLAQLKIGAAQPNDIVAAVGVPCVGEEVVPAEEAGEIADTADMMQLRGASFIHELIPVGSMGIKRETQTLAEGANLSFTMLTQHVVNVVKSAGPATVILAALAENEVTIVKRLTNKPVSIVAQLHL